MRLSSRWNSQRTQRRPAFESARPHSIPSGTTRTMLCVRVIDRRRTPGIGQNRTDDALEPLPRKASRHEDVPVRRSCKKGVSGRRSELKLRCEDCYTAPASSDCRFRVALAARIAAAVSGNVYVARLSRSDPLPSPGRRSERIAGRGSFRRRNQEYHERWGCGLCALSGVVGRSFAPYTAPLTVVDDSRNLSRPGCRSWRSSLHCRNHSSLAPARSSGPIRLNNRVNSSDARLPPS
jgi:hypothetical protein